MAEIEKLLSLSLSDSPTQSKETIEAFEKNKHKLKSKTKLLKPDKPKNKGQSLLYIFEDKDLGNAGDFRSQDCIELLKRSDIVVTNPPFSLFREYVAQLVEYNKKFVIIGNKNAITYKEIFTFIKENKIWIGYTPMSKDLLFDTTEECQKEVLSGKKLGSGYKIIDGVVKLRSQSIWFTNLDIEKRHEILDTLYSYGKTPENYPKYDNYDAINVDKTKEIPTDYDGVMGVPISFLDKHNPEQFELLGLDNHLLNNGLGKGCNSINGNKIYRRIIIQKRHLRGAHSVGSKPSEDNK